METERSFFGRRRPSRRQRMDAGISTSLFRSAKTISTVVLQLFYYSCFICLIINTKCDLTMVHASYSDADDLINELDRPSEYFTMFFFPFILSFVFTSVFQRFYRFDIFRLFYFFLRFAAIFLAKMLVVVTCSFSLLTCPLFSFANRLLFSHSFSLIFSVSVQLSTNALNRNQKIVIFSAVERRIGLKKRGKSR